MHRVYGGAPSGNTAIDWQNRTGLQKGKDKVFCSYFAQRDPETEQRLLVMAYSTDGGMSFTRLETPVHFTPEEKRRYDPDVFWYEKDEKWIMVASEHHSKFIFFESTNLIDWNEFYTLDNRREYEEMWDCVDMYPIEVEEEPGTIKWIVSFSLFTKTEGQYTSQAYFVGDFDGKKFTLDTQQYQFFDQGPDLHAGITWSEIPNNQRRIFIAWFGNWRGSGNKIPTKPWWGTQTLPREVTLHATEKGYRLYSQPVEEYKCLRYDKSKSTTSLPSQYEMEYTIDRSRDSQIVLSNTLGEQIVFGYKATVDTFYFDRSQAGQFDRRINYPKYHSFKVESQGNHLKVRVLIDNSVAELFINGGEYTMSEQFFPEKPFQIMQMEPLVSDLKIWKLENIWDRSNSRPRLQEEP
jgi:fructan beta-fructosidase